MFFAWNRNLDNYSYVLFSHGRSLIKKVLSNFSYSYRPGIQRVVMNLNVFKNIVYASRQVNIEADLNVYNTAFVFEISSLE